MANFEDHSEQARALLVLLRKLIGRTIIFGEYSSKPSTAAGKEHLPFVIEQMFEARVAGVRVSSTGRPAEGVKAYGALMLEGNFFFTNGRPIDYLLIEEIDETKVMRGRAKWRYPPGVSAIEEVVEIWIQVDDD